MTTCWSLSTEQEARFEQLYRAWLTHALRVERMLLDATAALDHAGIASRVLKGVALAHTVYDDPGDRVFGDVDLLVPGIAADAFRRGAGGRARRRAPAARAATGVRRPLRQGGDAPGREPRARSAPHVRRGRVRAHRAPRRPLRAAVPVSRSGSPSSKRSRCRSGCSTRATRRRSATGRRGSMSLRDVAQLVLREQPNLVDVLLMARSWQCEPVVARAVDLAWDELALDPSTRRSSSGRDASSRRAHQRRMLAWHEGPARAFTRQVAAVLVLRGTSEPARLPSGDRVPAALVSRARVASRRRPLPARRGTASSNDRAHVYVTRGYHALALDFALAVEDDDARALLRAGCSTGSPNPRRPPPSTASNRTGRRRRRRRR